MTIFILTLFAAAAAFAGGYVAIKSRSHLHMALALTAGLVLGLVAFDLLPEIFEGASAANIDITIPMVLLVLGFLFFHALEKIILVHHGQEEEYGAHVHPNIGIARGIALAAHSFIDGLSIGIAFQINTSVGFAVALAVIGHRFADGFDTANFMLLHKNKPKDIQKFLAIVVAMPIVGGLLSLVLTLPEHILTLYLGFFAGILLYIAASNILPQAHTKAPSYGTLFLTVVGACIMLVITQFH